MAARCCLVVNPFILFHVLQPRLTSALSLGTCACQAGCAAAGETRCYVHCDTCLGRAGPCTCFGGDCARSDPRVRCTPAPARPPRRRRDEGGGVGLLELLRFMGADTQVIGGGRVGGPLPRAAAATTTTHNPVLPTQSHLWVGVDREGDSTPGPLGSLIITLGPNDEQTRYMLKTEHFTRSYGKASAAEIVPGPHTSWYGLLSRLPIPLSRDPG